MARKKVWGKNPRYKEEKSKSFKAFEKLLLEAEAESIFFHYFCVCDLQKFLCKSYQSEYDCNNPTYNKAMYCPACLTAFFSGIWLFKSTFIAKL